MRLVRRHAAGVRPDRQPRDVEDWFLLAEAAAIDRWIAPRSAGWCPLWLRRVRTRSDATCIVARPTPDAAFEREVHAFLAADPADAAFRSILDDSVEQLARLGAAAIGTR